MSTDSDPIILECLGINQARDADGEKDLMKLNLIFDLEGTLINHRLKQDHLPLDLFGRVRVLSNRHAIYLLTSKTQGDAEGVLAYHGAADIFKKTVGRDTYQGTANKAESLSFLIEKEALDDGVTVMIGDRPQDMTAGRGNSVCAIGVLWGNGTRHELEEVGADYLCTNWDELTKTIEFLASEE